MILPTQPENQGQTKGFQFRRMPAASRNIAGIDPEKDIRVKLLGRVIDKYDNTIVMDDGTAKAEIVIEDTNIPFSDINSGDMVRIFARVLPLETSYELRAEIVQNMNGLELDLHKKVYGNL